MAAWNQERCALALKNGQKQQGTLCLILFSLFNPQNHYHHVLSEDTEVQIGEVIA